MKQEALDRLRKTYGYLASVTLFVTILHLIGFILFQSFSTYDSVTNEYSNTYGMMFSFSSAQFAMTLGSLRKDFGFVKIMGAIVSVLLGLSIIFLSTQAVKGKLLCHYIGVGLYFFDSCFLIPEAILSAQMRYPLGLSTGGIIVSVILHAVFLIVLGYSLWIAIRISKAEMNMPIQTSKENKSL